MHQVARGQSKTNTRITAMNNTRSVYSYSLSERYSFQRAGGGRAGGHVDLHGYPIGDILAAHGCTCCLTSGHRRVFPRPRTMLSTTSCFRCAPPYTHVQPSVYLYIWVVCSAAGKQQHGTIYSKSCIHGSSVLKGSCKNRSFIPKIRIFLLLSSRRR